MLIYLFILICLFNIGQSQFPTVFSVYGQVFDLKVGIYAVQCTTQTDRDDDNYKVQDVQDWSVYYWACLFNDSDVAITFNDIGQSAFTQVIDIFGQELQVTAYKCTEQSQTTAYYMIKDSNNYYWACQYNDGSTIITYSNINYTTGSNNGKIIIGDISIFGDSENYVTELYFGRIVLQVYQVVIKTILESTDNYYVINAAIYQPSSNNTKLVRNRIHQVVRNQRNTNMSLTESGIYYKLGNTYISTNL